MSKTAKPRKRLSAKSEKPKKRAPRREILPGQLVCTRTQTAHTLNRSIPIVIRLENAGVLRKFRLDPSKPTSQVVHSVKQVLALASGGQADA